MKVIIKLTRKTEYIATVEMDEATFNRLNLDLDGGRVETNRAEKEINRLIKADDWADDSFNNLDEFRAATPEEQ